MQQQSLSGTGLPPTTGADMPKHRPSPGGMTDQEWVDFQDRPIGRTPTRRRQPPIVESDDERPTTN